MNEAFAIEATAIGANKICMLGNVFSYPQLPQENFVGNHVDRVYQHMIATNLF